MAALDLWHGLLGSPMRLSPQMVARYPELEGVRWRRGGLPPRVGGWCLGSRTVAAITLWRTVWLGDEVRETEELLLHELCHVQQFVSVPIFPVRYIWESIRRGYLANRFEVEARQFATASIRGAGHQPLREDA